MKNNNFILLLFSIILLNSCEDDEVSTNKSEDITSIEIKELANSFSQYFESKETLTTAFENSRANYLKAKSGASKEISMTINVDMTSDEVRYYKEDLPSIYSNKQKDFLLNYFNRVANVTNGELLTEISYYKSLLKSQSFEVEEYNQIYVILDVAEQTVVAINDMLPKEDSANYLARSNGDWRGFLKCMGSKGKSIARGMVEGAVAGGIAGAYAGAAGGTVVLPLVGTATGAVGGAVFGAANGAVVSAIGATLWAAADCGNSGPKPTCTTMQMPGGKEGVEVCGISNEK